MTQTDPVRPVGTPHTVKHEIYWRETEPVEPGPPLPGDTEADLCIIGGGYTGLWTAYFLKKAEPSLNIHIVESEYAGAGASGHNDGFVTPTIGHGLHALIHRFGPEQARTAYSVVGRSMLELDRFCRHNGVDAELESSGYFQVATNPAQVARLHADVALIERLGSRGDMPVLDAAAMRERIGSPAIQAGFKVGGALINPHKLARGLARVVREAGVPIHEGTRATAVRHDGRRHVVTTTHGRVLAPKLLLATNAYQHQFAGQKAKVVPVWSYAAVTEPLTDEQLARVDWPYREGFVEARNFILFGRLTAGNRLLIGGGRAHYHRGRDMREDRYMHDPAVARELRETLERYFPQWRDVRFSHSYGGCIAMTRDLVPHVGAAANGVYYAHGYCGNGIAMTLTAGKSLRDLILERESAYTRLLFVNRKESRFPPEPLAYLGASGLSALLAVQDRFPRLIKRQLV